MEFWNGIFFEVSWHKLESSQTRVLSDSSLCLVFYPHFPFYKIVFMNRPEFSCFSDFCKGFKTREEYGFLENPPVELTVNSMDQRFKSLVNLISKNSISGPVPLH
jgi:hypothetical protein